MRVFSRAPGKLILIGEHAVVYGYPALVATVDLHATVQIDEYTDGKVKFLLTRFNYEKEYYWEDIFKDFERSLQDVEKFKETGDQKYLQRLKGTSNLPKFAIVELLKFADKNNPRGMVLSGDSTVPIGGFGASSAAGGAIVKALDEFWNLNLSEDDLIEVLMRTETMLHGYRPSGIDQTAVIKEGVIKLEFDGEGETRKMISEKLKYKSDLLSDVLIIQSGKPENTTGEVVDMVRKRKSIEGDKIDGIFKDIEKETYRLLDALVKNEKKEFYDAIDVSGELLIDLGIVTQDTQSLIKKLQDLGGHVKVSGAGAISGSGSGALLCFADDLEDIEKYIKDKSYEYFRLKLG